MARTKSGLPGKGEREQVIDCLRNAALDGSAPDGVMVAEIRKRTKLHEGIILRHLGEMLETREVKRLEGEGGRGRFSLVKSGARPARSI